MKMPKVDKTKKHLCQKSPFFSKKYFSSSTIFYSRFGDWRSNENKLVPWNFTVSGTHLRHQQISLRAYFGYQDANTWRNCKNKVVNEILKNILQNKFQTTSVTIAGIVQKKRYTSLTDCELYSVMCEQALKEITGTGSFTDQYLLKTSSPLHFDRIEKTQFVYSKMSTILKPKQIATERRLIEKASVEYELIHRGKAGLAECLDIWQSKTELRLVVVVHDDGNYHEIMEYIPNLQKVNYNNNSVARFLDHVRGGKFGPKAFDDLQEIEKQFLSCK